ncbi:MAG: ABC transporter permease [Lachnospira sp.]
MFKYIIKRIALGLLTLYVLITITFFLTRLMPGNPFSSDNISATALAQLNSRYGLDKPVSEQYWMYIQNLLHGDLGVSYKKTGVTVNTIIANGLPNTVSLGLTAFIFSMVVGILMGIWMASTKKEWVRGILLTFTTLGVSVPNFVFAILLMLVFGVYLRVFPATGLDTPAHYVLPVIAMAAYPISQISRLVQSSYSEALNQDYVVMAKAKGLNKTTIIFKHILKNAILPVITIAGPMIAFLLTGSFVIENVFAIPGIGREFVNAISNRDYTIIMGLTIFIGAMIIVCNLIVDVISAIVDPRIKLSSK